MRFQFILIYFYEFENLIIYTFIDVLTILYKSYFILINIFILYKTQT